MDVSLIGDEHDTYRSLQARVKACRGYMPLTGHKKGPEANWNGAGPWKPAFEWEQAVRTVVADCEDRSIPLLIRIGPERDDLQGRDFSTLETWLTKLASEHANVRISRPVLLWYERDLMWDPNHVNARGVVRFMPLVVRDVQSALNDRQGGQK